VRACADWSPLAFRAAAAGSRAVGQRQSAGIVGAGFGAQDAVTVLVTARVVLGKRRLVLPAQHRMTSLTLVEHGLEFAVVLAADSPAEQMRGALGAAHQHAKLARALEPCHE